LGDNRHAPKQANAVKYAFDFHALLNCQYLFEGRPGDVHAPLETEYVELMGYDYDVLEGVKGCLFGINKSELPFGERSDTGRILTNSEIIVRAWNALYFAERLSKTELEYSLITGPDAMRSLFCTGIHLAMTLFPKEGHLACSKRPLRFPRITSNFPSSLRKEVLCRNATTAEKRLQKRMFAAAARSPCIAIASVKGVIGSDISLSASATKLLQVTSRSASLLGSKIHTDAADSLSSRSRFDAAFC
jgi:hypothetical protein